MNLGTAFWVLVLIAIVFGVFGGVVATTPGYWWAPLGSDLLKFVLICILGWQVFGPILKKGGS